MVSALSSDITLRLALWAGLASVATSLFLVMLILCMRGALLIRTRHHARFLTVWRPLLAECLLALPPDIPRVPAREAIAFFNLWNYVHESVRGEARERLNTVARQSGADALAVTLLETGRLDERLMAIATLGSLGEKSAWSALSRIAAHEHPILSFTAARALMQINPEGSIGLVISSALVRPDWPFSKVAALLKETGADIVSRPLVHALWEADDRKSVLLLRYMKVAHYTLAAPSIRKRLHVTESVEVLCACLSLLEDPVELEAVREFVRHPVWAVRVQAVRALGRIGSTADARLLLEAMGDAEWWVRHRAGEALALLTGGSLPRHLLVETPEDYGRILTLPLRREQSTGSEEEREAEWVPERLAA